jgi:cytochrome c
MNPFISKTTRTLAVLCTTAAMTSLSHAADPVWLPLAQENGCTSCHSITEKIVGPAFQSVAQKYANDPDAVSTLMQSIQNGSRGGHGAPSQFVERRTEAVGHLGFESKTLSPRWQQPPAEPV